MLPAEVAVMAGLVRHVSSGGSGGSGRHESIAMSQCRMSVIGVDFRS